MTPETLLEKCLQQLKIGMRDIIFVWPHGHGRFPFLGKGTELLSATPDHNNYSVPISTILKKVAKLV